MAGAYLGPEDEAAGLLDDLAARAGAAPESAVLVHASFRATKRALADTGGEPDPLERDHVESRSEFFAGTIPADAIAALVAHLARDRRPGEARELDFGPFGGAYTRVASDATAFVHRDARFLLKHAVAVDIDAGAAARAAARALARALVRDLSTPSGPAASTRTSPRRASRTGRGRTTARTSSGSSRSRSATTPTTCSAPSSRSGPVRAWGGRGQDCADMDATQATEKTFTSLVGELDYPMFIVTTVAGDGERSGCLIGFATQISIDPPRFLVGLSEKNHTYRVAQRAEHVAVHFVPADGEEIAELFGSETGDEVDKFARCAWHEGPAGCRSSTTCRTGSPAASASGSRRATTTPCSSTRSPPSARPRSRSSPSTARSGSSRGTPRSPGPWRPSPACIRTARRA